jgi:hypothetical protein
LPHHTPADEPSAVEDVGFNGPETSIPVVGVSNVSLTDDANGVIICPHGYSVRLRFNIPLAQAQGALTRCGWSQEPSPTTWKVYGTNGRQRYVLKGTAWLTHRAPNNKRLPLARMNREWRTKLYALAVELTRDGIFIDLQGVREQDIARFMRDVLGLADADFTIQYFRAAERYVAVLSQEARRLAASDLLTRCDRESDRSRPLDGLVRA